MSTKLSAGRIRSIYEFFKANRSAFSVQAMCRMLDVVAPSGYYAWLKKRVSNRAQEDARGHAALPGSLDRDRGGIGDRNQSSTFRSRRFAPPHAPSFTEGWWNRVAR
jgi:hypothetical protein